MRALKPWIGQLLAVLLVFQWAGAAAACLSMMGPAAIPAAAICHAEDPDAPPAPDSMPAGCPLCAPLPPGLLPVPAAIAPATLRATRIASPPPAVLEAAAAPPQSPQQPRAPPIPA